MSGEVKKIDSIKNMAVFQDFQWNSSIRDNGNNVAEFKKINILYGRNYSGKTTLSRIFRALETGAVSNKYQSPEFNISFKSNEIVTQNCLDKHGQVIRVFNEDFIKDNLHFIIDDEQSIDSFAVLGEDNTKLENEIEKNEAELGNEEKNTGLLGKFGDAEGEFKKARYAYENKSSEIENKLRDKANKPGTGIKHNKLFGDANYNVTKIKADISVVTKDSYRPLTEEKVEEFYNLLKEEPKKEILESNAFNLQYSHIAAKAMELVEKKIQVSEPIQDLLEDALLSEWVEMVEGIMRVKEISVHFVEIHYLQIYGTNSINTLAKSLKIYEIHWTIFFL